MVVVADSVPTIQSTGSASGPRFRQGESCRLFHLVSVFIVVKITEIWRCCSCKTNNTNDAYCHTCNFGVGGWIWRGGGGLLTNACVFVF